VDNVTHTLIGVTLGTLAAREEVPPRSQAILVAVIASNIPDFDFIGKIIYGGSNLAYLMHHRGWTHTVLLSPFLAAASLGILRWILGKKIGGRQGDLPKEQRRELRRYGRKRLFFIAWAAILLHLFADYWNDYGVHPFSPFSNKWFYGDFLFITEPAIWVAMLPLLYFGFSNKWTRFAAIGLAVLAGVVALFGPQGGLGAFLLLSAWGAAILYAEVRYGRQYANGAVAAAGVFLVLFTFKVASLVARSEVEGSLGGQLKGETVLQTVLSPFPANPFLWRAIVATSGPKYNYTVRLGTVSVLPGLKSPLAEFYGVRMERMAPMVPPSVSSKPGVNWIGEFRGSVLDYTRLAFKSCEFATLLKWARVPFWREEPGRTVAGDLRYDHEKGMGFAKVILKTDHESSEPCPDFDAPWQPPIQFNQGG
jgi:inner membrane protein